LCGCIVRGMCRETPHPVPGAVHVGQPGLFTQGACRRSRLFQLGHATAMPPHHASCAFFCTAVHFPGIQWNEHPLHINHIPFPGRAVIEKSQYAITNVILPVAEIADHFLQRPRQAERSRNGQPGPAPPRVPCPVHCLPVMRQ
jgi:hypothetical protein